MGFTPERLILLAPKLRVASLLYLIAPQPSGGPRKRILVPMPKLSLISISSSILDMLILLAWIFKGWPYVPNNLETKLTLFASIIAAFCVSIEPFDLRVTSVEFK